MKKVSASIMCADFLELGKTIQALNNAEYDYIHFDVMDGSFHPDYLLGNKLINDVRSISKLNHEYHLMIRDPEAFIEQLEVASTDHIIVHYELCSDTDGVLDKIRQKGCGAGIAINADTSDSAVSDYFDKIDVVLVMLIHAGGMGRELQEHCLEKVKRLKKRITCVGYNIMIGVDGSVNSGTIPRLKEYGANIFVGGSSGLFRRGVPIEEAIYEFKKLVIS